MSAIFGLINLDGRPVSVFELELMSTALRPYGPDAQGLWTDQNIGLGQCLMRFTPEDSFERQPAFSQDGQRVLVSDARIDNRAELQDELGIPPAEASELPDSAFILRAYDRWGTDCAKHLSGAFAFALCDLRIRSVLFARSPMAERSFFYYETAAVFAFASAPKGLFALPFIERRIDRRSIADFLVLYANEPGSSHFLGIHRLKAGHLIVAQGGKTESRQYRALEIQREIRFRRDEDYVEAFCSLFDRVVADHLRSATPAGVWLSGGLDSTIIAASAAVNLRRHNSQLHGFTAIPPPGFSGALPSSWYADETHLVESMARDYENLNLHFIRSHGFYVDHLDMFFEAAESPMLGAAHLPWVTTLQEEARRANVRVLLNGTLGNFTISYDGHRLLAQLARQGRWGQGLRQARALSGPVSNASFFKLVISLGLMPLLPDRIWLIARQVQSGIVAGRPPKPFWHATSPIRMEFARSQGIEERYPRAGHCFRPHLGPASRAAAMLWRADRRGDARRAEESLYGIQNRDVPGDLRLLEFCLSIPEDQYLRDGTSRWLIRRAGAGRLPEMVRNNEMRGMQSADWFQALESAGPALHQEMDRLENSTLAREILDVERLRRLVESIPAAGDSHTRTLDYRAVLEHGLAMGRFLQWIESGR